MKMTIDALSSEERMTYYYFYVLDKIHEGLILHRSKDGSIRYDLLLFPSLNDPYKPNPTQEQQLIDNLIRDKVLEETEERGNFQIGKLEIGKLESAGVYYSLKTVNPAFETMHRRYSTLVKGYQIGNILTFYPNDGTMVYISPKGEEYKGKVRVGSNSYMLLEILIRHQHKVVKFDDLTTNFKELKNGADSSNERRARDAVEYIKEKLKYYGDDLFISDYGFGLNCDVNLR